MNPRTEYWILAGSAAFMSPIVVYLTALFTPGHSHVHDYISDLGALEQPHAMQYVLGGTFVAILNVLLVWAWSRLLRGRPLYAIPLVAFALFFVVQWVGAAVFPCDPGCARLEQTGKIHYALGVTAFSLTAIVYFGASIVAWREHNPRQMPLHIAMGFAAALTLWLLAADLTQTLVGLAERFTMFAFAGWTLAFAWMMEPAADFRNRS